MFRASLPPLLAALALAGCATAAQQRADSLSCEGIGAPQGTENHDECRARMAEIKAQAQEAKPAAAAADPGLKQGGLADGPGPVRSPPR